MTPSNDPRVRFAAERTLLAWIRTGLATIGLGFVVARFGLFLRLAGGEADASSHRGSTLIGVGLVLLGSAAMAVAAWQFRIFCRRLGASELPAQVTPRWPVAFAAIIAAIGLALAVYLLMRS